MEQMDHDSSGFVSKNAKDDVLKEFRECLRTKVKCFGSDEIESIVQQKTKVCYLISHLRLKQDSD